MERSLLAILFTIPMWAEAQTYFHVSSISISPPAPTTADAIAITLDGALSSTGTYVINTSWSMIGNAIICTVNCGQGIGFDVLVPHSEIFNIGMLAAGTYTVELNGTGMGDLAPPGQHQFVVTGGGGACDSLIVDHIRWSPFSDSTLEVHVYNNSSQLFDYPGFVLLDQNNDTLARENVFYFGIAPESWHTLAIHPGAVIPQGSFACTLHLWTGFYMTEACVFNTTTDLCPANCVNLFPYITNIGSQIPATDFTWLIQDEFANDVALGTLQLDTVTTNDADTACLQPGHYVLYVNCSTVPGGELHYGFFTNWTNYGAHQTTFVQGGEPNILTIPFYLPCTGSFQGVPDHRRDQTLCLVLRNDELNISRTDGLALGDLRLIDPAGRVVITMRSDNATATMNVRGLADGIYTVLASSDGRSMLGRVALVR